MLEEERGGDGKRFFPADYEYIENRVNSPIVRWQPVLSPISARRCHLAPLCVGIGLFLPLIAAKVSASIDNVVALH